MKNFSLCVVALFVAALTSCSWIGSESRRLESWQTDNGMLRIRITSYRDPGFVPLPGASYVFESSFGNDGWHEIATVHKDLAEPIPTESVHFVDDQTVFMSMRWMFAVSTNGGRDWHVWDSGSHKYANPDIEWGTIESVSINADGKGEMILQVFPSSGRCQALFSQDFGQTWTERGSHSECSN